MTTWLVLTAVLALQGPVEGDRESDMFGDASSETPPSDAPAMAPVATQGDDDRDAALFGGNATEGVPSAAPSPLPSSTTPGLMEDLESSLAIGGQLFLRMNGSFREGVSVNDGAITGPSLLDAFADVRPNERVRAYAQLRFNFDYTVLPGEKNAFGADQVPFSLQLAQAWTKFDLGQVAYITAGRQRIRWGTGRFWNPTDFINQEIRNSVDFFDQRVGVDLVKVHFPFEALGWNLYLIGLIGGIDVVKDTGIAARAEFVFGPAELALSAFVKDNAPLRLGADISAGVWLFDVKAEGVLSRGLSRRLFKGELDFEAGTLPTEVDTDGQWYFEGVLGAETQLKYTDTDTVNFGVEYFYNQAGYSSAALYPFLFFNGAYVPLYTGQHYGALYASAASPFDFKDLTLIVSTLGNLSDLSFLTRLDVQYTVLQYLTVNAFVVGHWGSIGEFKLGIDIPPLPQVPQLAQGLTLANDMVDVGLAVRMAF